MPNTKFLEEYPLYKKFPYVVPYPYTLDLVPKVPIHMYCDICKSDQTFNMVNEYYNAFRFSNTPAAGNTTEVRYVCSACNKYLRIFSLKFDNKGSYIMKVGQEPPWDISVDKNLLKALGNYGDYYKKGLICESQGYGIGAYAYYRRVVEEVIDELLDSILDLIEDKEKDKYKQALEKTKKTRVAQEKIDLVKDLLPTSLRPSGMNPLSVLHDCLSEGLHGKSDEECLELACNVKDTLIYLLNQIIRDKEAKKTFTESMKKILEKKK